MAIYLGNTVAPQVQDTVGRRAILHTPYVFNAAGTMLLPHPVDAQGTPVVGLSPGTNTVGTVATVPGGQTTNTLTTEPLAAGATYTQAWQDTATTSTYYVAGSVTADQPGTAYVDLSDDGVLVAQTLTVLAFTPATAGTANAQTFTHPTQITTRYYRTRYVNGATAQGTCAVYQTLLPTLPPRDVGLTGSNVPYAPGVAPWTEAPAVVPALAGGGGAWNQVGAMEGSDGVNIGAVGAMGHDDTQEAYYSLRVIPNTTGVVANAYSGKYSVAITTATTTAVKASGGAIGTIINAGGATSGAISIYDNTSATGKLIWAGTLTAGQVLPLGIPCGTGITITTAAANTITVSYA